MHALRDLDLLAEIHIYQTEHSAIEIHREDMIKWSIPEQSVQFRLSLNLATYLICVVLKFSITLSIRLGGDGSVSVSVHACTRTHSQSQSQGQVSESNRWLSRCCWSLEDVLNYLHGDTIGEAGGKQRRHIFPALWQRRAKWLHTACRESEARGTRGVINQRFFLDMSEEIQQWILFAETAGVSRDELADVDQCRR
jgi:hypothetical protein